MNRRSGENVPARRLLSSHSVHEAEEIVSRYPLRASGNINTRVKYQIYYYNGLTCQQKRGENVESRIATRFFQDKKIQLKIRCFTGETHELKIPGLGSVPLNAVVAAAGGFLKIDDTSRTLLKSFVDEQWKEIYKQMKLMRKVVIIGHSLGGRIVNMLAEKVNKLEPVFRNRFTIITLGAVEKANLDKIDNLGNKYWQVMNVDDLVVKNMLFSGGKNNNYANRITKARDAAVMRMSVNKLSNAENGQFVIPELPIPWVKWKSLTKVVLDKANKIVWIKTTATDPDKIHGDYDKKEGLIDAVLKYFTGMIPNNNAQHIKNAKNIETAAGILYSLKKNRTLGLPPTVIKVLRKKAANIRSKNVNAAFANILFSMNKNRTRNSGRNANANTGRNANANANTGRNANANANTGRNANAGNLLRITRLLPNLNTLIRNTGEMKVKNLISLVSSKKQLIESLIEDVKLLLSGRVSSVIGKRLTKEQLQPLIDIVLKQISRILVAAASENLDWSLSMILLEPDDINKLKLTKGNKTFFTTNNLYTMASNNKNLTHYPNGSLIPNRINKIDLETKRTITYYVRYQIRTNGPTWFIPRLERISKKMAEQIATGVIIHLAASGGTKIAKDKALRLAFTLGPAAALALFNPVAGGALALVKIGGIVRGKPEKNLGITRTAFKVGGKIASGAGAAGYVVSSKARNLALHARLPFLLLARKQQQQQPIRMNNLQVAMAYANQQAGQPSQLKAMINSIITDIKKVLPE